MIESKLQKKLRWAMPQVSLVTLVLLVCGGLLFSHLQSLQKDAVREQVVAEAEEYKSRIVKQLKSDFQTLSALSHFLDDPSDEDSWSQLTQKLQAATQESNFLSMAFYNTDLRGSICTQDKDPLTNVPLSELAPEAQSAVHLAIEGTSSVSRLFKSTISQQQVFAYSIPVYAEGRVIGVLFATDYMEIFSDILSGNTVLGVGATST